MSKKFDVVGSYLRPESLKKARADFDAENISKEEFTRVKNEAVKALVEKQKAAGLPYITDGEYNRKFWHLDFFWGFDGIEHKKDGGGVQLTAKLQTLKIHILLEKLRLRLIPLLKISNL